MIPSLLILVASAVALSACTSAAQVATIDVYTPIHPATANSLTMDAAILRKRLRVIGDSSDMASVRAMKVVITGHRLKVPATDLDQVGHFYIRPVLCGAPAYSPTVAGGIVTPSPLPRCQSQYATTAANLDLNSDIGQPTNTIGPDPIFASVPSTSADDVDPSNSVLLPTDPKAGAQQYARFVLGKASLDASAIASASALFDNSIDAWAVTYTLTPSGSRAWDQVAEANFHQYVALDLDGLVMSAPLIQPNQSSFTSFDGRGEISGNFNAVSAKALAAVLASGPLVAPLRLQTGH